MRSNIAIEVDGVRIPDARLVTDKTIYNGQTYGYERMPQDGYMCVRLTQSIWGVNFRTRDGGMAGFFKHGEWAETDDGKILLRVWERIV